MRHRHEEIRRILRESDNGLTLMQLAAKMGTPHVGSLNKTLKLLPDAYIDHWTASNSTCPTWVQVWNVAPLPEDCPKPDRPAPQAKSVFDAATIQRVRNLAASKRLSMLAISKTVGMSKTTVARIVRGDGIYGRL